MKGIDFSTPATRIARYFLTVAPFTVKPGQAYPPRNINEFIIQKLNPLLVVDFRLISAFHFPEIDVNVISNLTKYREKFS